MKIKLDTEVIYPILKFVFFTRKINRIPRKKNSSVNVSTKLIIPNGRWGIRTSPIRYLTKNVTINMTGIKRKPSFRLFSNPFSVIPNCSNEYFSPLFFLKPPEDEKKYEWKEYKQNEFWGNI